MLKGFGSIAFDAGPKGDPSSFMSQKDSSGLYGKFFQYPSPEPMFVPQPFRALEYAVSNMIISKHEFLVQNLPV